MTIGISGIAGADLLVPGDLSPVLGRAILRKTFGPRHIGRQATEQRTVEPGSGVLSQTVSHVNEVELAMEIRRRQRVRNGPYG